MASGEDAPICENFDFRYLVDAPIVDVDAWPRLAGNANGPTLIRAPDWLPEAPGCYLLYFAHHEGESIRLACGDDLAGPWRLHEPDPLLLANSGFATRPVHDTELDPEARAHIAAGADGCYPHIASPDAWVDHERREIRLYFHGRLQNGLQRTRVAISRDGLRFTARDEILALPYLRILRHADWFYAIAMPAQLYRSRDGLGAFEAGPRLTEDPIRHHAMLQLDGRCWFFWTRIGDCPERILVSELFMQDDWRHWRLGKAREVHRAHRPWEGSEQPLDASLAGAVMQPANQLRDPAVFVEDGRIFLLYAVAGERGIGISELVRR